MLPPAIPLFPLPSAVLFPNVFLPLHVFEPRYRAMVADALAGDRIVGMVLLRPGWEADYEGHPPVYPVGCAGVVTHAEALADGRFDIVLRGLQRFRITGEEWSRPYRLAQVEALPDPLRDQDRPVIRQQRHRLEALLALALERSGVDPKLPQGVADEDLINALAQYLDLDPIERQALLERDGVLARCGALVDLLEMKTLAPRGLTWSDGAMH